MLPTSRFALLAALASLFAVACSGSPEGDGASADDEEAATSTSYTNPLLATGGGEHDECPDPNVKAWGKNYVMVCTSPKIGGTPDAFPLRVSSNLVNWGKAKYVFTQAAHPRWAKSPGDGGHYWAPEINRIGNKWHIVFAATSSDPSKGNSMAIGAATAESLDGPWTPSKEPLVSQGDGSIAGPGDETSGRIDPTIVRDPESGKLILYYVYQPDHVHAVELADDGLSVVGPDHALKLEDGQDFTATLPWESDTRDGKTGHVIEGVEAHVRDGKIYLLYSGASTWDGSYAVGVARADSAFGPFEKHGAPILSTRSGGKLVGPGHSSQWVVGPDGKTYLHYHVQERGKTGVNAPRLLAVDEVTFGSDGWPRVNDGHPSEHAHATP